MLNEREAQYVKTLMKWDQRRMQLGWFFMVVLAAGGLVILATALITLPRLNDKTALWLTLPGLLIGALLIAISMAGILWIKQRHLIASILKKLGDRSEDHARSFKVTSHT
ncbi:MAG TPA: hypothetical protein VI758_01890 [Bacteroidota bacterium]